jgi:LDH2 family malate/lactate/ureidoglycolate dehydrogenase
MRPDLFVSPSDYAKRMESLITRAKEGRRAAGFDEILMPGEPEERLANSRRRQGIALNRTERTLLAEEAKLVGTPPLT